MLFYFYMYHIHPWIWIKNSRCQGHFLKVNVIPISECQGHFSTFGCWPWISCSKCFPLRCLSFTRMNNFLLQTYKFNPFFLFPSHGFNLYFLPLKVPIWACFLKSQPEQKQDLDRSVMAIMDGARLQCCYKASTVGCRNLCSRVRIAISCQRWTGNHID